MRCDRTVSIQIYVSLAVSMLDAPVSGGVMAAETATLTFMVCVHMTDGLFMKFILAVSL